MYCTLLLLLLSFEPHQICLCIVIIFLADHRDHDDDGSPKVNYKPSIKQPEIQKKQNVRGRMLAKLHARIDVMIMIITPLHIQERKKKKSLIQPIT